MTTTSTIYVPRGKALEYSPLALNLYKGCAHACTYCYAPSATFTPRDIFSTSSYIKPRANIIDKVRADAKKLAGDPREILMSFTTDPYQPCEKDYGITREALKILKDHNLRPTILTKGGCIAQRDFDLLADIKGAAFATTLTTGLDHVSTMIEPFAALPRQRIENLLVAHAAGIRTWVSFEPVINPGEVMNLIDLTHKFVDLYKVGKWNYDARAKEINWVIFRERVIEKLESLGKDYIIKKDLLDAV